jgi:hypothetical protein
MGLWLKCPKCQAANPLDLKSCLECNASLENLPAAERVYLLGKRGPRRAPGGGSQSCCSQGGPPPPPRKPQPRPNPRPPRRKWTWR